MSEDAKQQNSQMQKSITALGLNFAYIPESRIFSCFNMPQKIDSCGKDLIMFLDSLKKGTATQANLLSVVGKISSLAYARRLKAGMEIMRFLHTTGTDEKWAIRIKNASDRAQLVKHLKFAYTMVYYQEDFKFSYKISTRKIAHIMSDASGGTVGKSGPIIGAILFHPDYPPQCWTLELPDFFRYVFDVDDIEYEMTIAFFEAAAEFLSVILWQDMLENMQIVFHIDNVNIVRAHTSGKSLSPKVSNIVIASAMITRKDTAN